jgi:putative ABC transport system ATP-binding protein
MRWKRAARVVELLELDGVCKSHRRGERRLRVLREVSLVLGAGEIVAIVGARYEGKTTLLKVAAGLERPDAGVVRFKGRALYELRTGERERLLGREIAWIDREGTGLPFDVLDYVALPLRVGRGIGDVEDRAMAALERVGAAGVARRRWADLSNWERVLVALARGVAARPALMVVDDVLDGLGMSKTRQAGELLCGLVQELGCGVLMSASDPEAALVADREWSFENGALKLMAGDAGASAEVIEFPRGVAAEARGSGGVGS